MAKFIGPNKFTGSQGGSTGYYDKDTGEYHLASKKPKDKNQNKNAPRALEQNNEFKAVCIWSKLIRRLTGELVYLKMGRLAGKLNAIAKKIQMMDSDGLKGYRTIESSKFNFPLFDFCFNNAHPFKNVFQVEPELSITDDRHEVTLKLTNFRSASKFKWIEGVMYYRLYLTIFELPDVAWKKSWNKFCSVYPPLTLGQKTVVSDWILVSTDPIDFRITAAFREGQLPREKTVVIAVLGLEFASGMEHGTPYVVKDHGTAAIVACF